MSNPEKAVRDAADKLHEAILTAARSGFAVQWPSRSAGLASIAISQTAKVAEKPVSDTPTIKNPTPDVTKETKAKA